MLNIFSHPLLKSYSLWAAEASSQKWLTLNTCGLPSFFCGVLVREPTSKRVSDTYLKSHPNQSHRKDNMEPWNRDFEARYEVLYPAPYFLTFRHANPTSKLLSPSLVWACYQSRRAVGRRRAVIGGPCKLSNVLPTGRCYYLVYLLHTLAQHPFFFFTCVYFHL